MSDQANIQHRIEHLEGLLRAAAHERHQLLETMGRYRAALVTIADAESGIWGRYAHAALHPESATSAKPSDDPVS